MSTSESTTSNAPARGSTGGAGAAESIKGTVHHIQGMGDTIRENAMDFVDTMFGTPRQPQSGEPRVPVGAARAARGEGVTVRGPASGERATAGDVPRGTASDDGAAPTSTSTASTTAGNANDTQTRTSWSQPATTRSQAAAEPGVAGKSGGPAKDPPTQEPPALPPRDG